ncbi:O-methyltransferase [Niabella hibiscisoli]|uniref:O-methyltransferase n=1 Tax=Niabella hibiscisoli TaxID=1825928 RepID=UPI001F114EDC|nr:class I SAM-dependent methyltransferase [Niabella hibiscisoli]MCH5717553.1 class I SAM-dependent methyltransferase [Niabella hibiscisoli]
MQDQVFNNIPVPYNSILAATRKLSFDMASDLQTGALLRTLVASKPGGKMLELGTGSGLSTSWILQGMDHNAHLTTIENNAQLHEVATKHLSDRRAAFVLTDGYQWLKDYKGEKFDFIFADAMPGKYDLFEEAFSLLNHGGIYFIDDMLPQPNWPEGHAERVENFIAMLDQRTDVMLTKLNWSTGIIIVTKNEK